MPRPFFVAFVARSGSGALMFDLDQHPQIRMAAEVMGARFLPGNLPQTDDNRLDWLGRWWKNPRIARGFKFQFNPGAPQFDELTRLADEMHAVGPVIVRLGRRDRTRHAVSALRAQALLPITEQHSGMATGHVFTTDPEALQAFRETPQAIDLEAFRNMVAGIEASTRYMDDFLAPFEGVVPVFYEDYLGDRLSVLNTVAAAIEVEAFAEAPPETIRKVSSDDLRKAVANFDELADVAAELGLRA